MSILYKLCVFNTIINEHFIKIYFPDVFILNTYVILIRYFNNGWGQNLEVIKLIFVITIIDILLRIKPRHSANRLNNHILVTFLSIQIM